MGVHDAASELDALARALEQDRMARGPVAPAHIWQRAMRHLVTTTSAREVPSYVALRAQRQLSTVFFAAMSFNGIHVEVLAGWYLQTTRYSSVWKLRSAVTAHLPMSLELGLDIRPGRSRSSLPSPAKGLARVLSTKVNLSPGVALGTEVGDPVLEERYYLHAHEPEQLRALLTTPIRAALVDSWRSASVTITDRYVQLERYEHVDEAFAVWAIHDSAWLARALVDAAAHVPVSPRLRPYLPAMKQVAAHTGLAFTTTPLGMRGLLRGIDVALTAFRDESTDQPGLRLQAAFPQPLGFGLHLRPSEDGTFGFLRPRDVQIGDRLLDDKLDIHATDPLGVQVVFDANARAMLHHLRDRGRVYVDDHTVSLESRGSVHPQDLLPTLHHVRDFAALLSEAARARRTGVVR